MDLNDAVPTIDDLKAQYGGNTDALCAEHEKLIE
jgi:hypothetical protein